MPEIKVHMPEYKYMDVIASLFLTANTKQPSICAPTSSLRLGIIQFRNYDK